MTDKNIVDRTRVSRNAAGAAVLRSTRERLQTGRFGSAGFEREMLVLHVNTVLQSAAAAPLLVILGAAGGIYLTHMPLLIIWAAVTLTTYSGLLFIAKRASRAEMTRQSATRWRSRFLIAHVLVGLCWALFAGLTAPGEAGPAFIVFKGVILLVALASTAMSVFAMRRALLFSFLPTAVVLTVLAIITRQSYDAGLAIVMSAAYVFFLFVSDRLHDSNVKLMSFQTEKDNLIAELEMAKSVSDEARRRAEEANLAKSRFLASMSHELRTPLNAILGFSEVMANEVLGPLENPSYKEYVGDIHRSGKHLLDLINEILDLSRIEAGRYELQEDAISLIDVAKDCVGMVQMKARGKSIAISQQYEPNLPPVWGDERSIRQVTLNLLSNAVKFTPQDGQIVVKVGWTAGGGQYVAIRDNGPGIPEDEIPIVMSAFGQGSIAIKSAEQGTGLGLPIVQAILAKHDGEFILKSKLREGTEVIAILPPKRVLVGPAAIDGFQEPARKKKKSFA